MNEEEKRSIKFTKEYLEEEKNLRDDYKWKSGFYANGDIERLLNLIEKQEKEIKARLEEIDSLYKMMSAKDDEIETLKESQLVLYGDNGQIVGVLKYTDDVIKKDKINAKIEELENTYDENNKNDYHNQFIVDCVAILEELLGE